MELNNATIDHIKEFEGVRLEAYRDPVGIWTIGYGHAETSGMEPIPKAGMVITQQEAEAILRRDLSVFARGVADLIKVPVTSNQFGAVVSLAFNIGLGAFRKSTCLRRLNAGDIQGAAEALTWFNKAGGQRLRGLVRRREAERSLMLSDDIITPDAAITGGEHKPMIKSKTNWASGGIVAAGLAMLEEVRSAVPDIAIDYLPYVIVAIGGYLIINRIMEGLQGEH